MVAMHAYVATILAHFPARSVQVFRNLDDPALPRLATSAPDKTRDVHSQVGMDFSKEKSRHARVENLSRQAVAPVAPGNAVAVHQIDPMSLQVARQRTVDGHAQFPRKEIFQRKVVISHQVMDFRSRIRQIAQDPIERKMPAGNVMAILVPEFEQVADQKDVRGFSHKAFQESDKTLFAIRNRARRIYAKMRIGKEVSRQ